MPDARRKAHTVLTHRERQERELQRAKARKRQMWIWLGIGAAALAGLVAALVLLSGNAEPVPGTAVPAGRADHVAPGTEVPYDRIPPSSGPHYAQTAQYGLQEQPIPEELWLHNLEHGAVAVLYNCPSGCPDLVDQLRQAYNTFPPSQRFGVVKMVITPYPQMQSRLAYLAWGRDSAYEFLTDEFRREQLLRFYQGHVDQGPELAP